MSEVPTEEEKAAAARRQPAPRGGPPGAGLGVPVEKPADFAASARRLAGLLRPQRAIVALATSVAVVGVVLTAIGPRILGWATDLVFAGVVGERLPPGQTKEQAVEGLRQAGRDQLADMVSGVPDLVPGQGMDLGAIGRVLLLAAALYAGAGVLTFVQNRLVVVAVNRVISDLRRDVEDKLHALPLPYLDGQPRGELLSRVTNDIDNLAQSVQQTLGQMLTNLVMVVAMLAMMFSISPLLAVIALVTIPVSIWVTKVIGTRSQRYFKQQWATTGEVNSIVEETFSGHELVKVFGRQEEVTATFEERNEALRRATFGAQFVSGVIMPVMMFVGNLTYVVVAVVGGLQVADGVLTLGSVVAFIQYSRQFTMPITQLASMANLVQSGVASAERVFEVLDAQEQRPDPVAPVVPERSDGRVTLEGVSFSYSPDRPLIEDLDLHVEPGQTVAIVGPTGAGKTTLVNLVLRFYELDAGRITLDGVDITRMSRAGLRSRIGMVLQDTWLFGGTIGENIAYGRPGADLEDVREAAQATFVDRFVHSLPDGYDTVLTDGATNISAGEKQLITIARAFLSDPDLLILDEATSSVDTRTEKLVQDAMRALRGQRTSFVIAHRLSTIRDADVILVMESGRIVEQGPHEQLLDRGGAYARLYEAQFVAPMDQEDVLLDPRAVPAGE
ncbi:ABC transporter ATP-binding protein [Janibacter sp. DB-40]|uniref:ABC transporter ATP-binding protein n=1 Tax=Janibacter sp. DB-40 TaxID=3028808 RepID=UPI002405FE66|nr:ABC transporter ATP-binding protein [Janibacter sp. DB-40]